MALGDSWHIRTKTHRCSHTEEPFKDGDRIYTGIFPDPESSGYLRKDYHLEGWRALDKTASPPFSFWNSTYKAPIKEDPNQVVKKEDATSILRRLVDDDEAHTENTRYILAVMLERQKLLVETDTQQTPSSILRVYEHRKEGDIFIIKDPNIPLSEIEVIQEEVVLMLENGGQLPDKELESPAGDQVTASEAPPLPSS